MAHPYEVLVPGSGFNAAHMVFDSLTGELYYKALANRLVKSKNEEELIQYIAEIFLGIESLKIEAARKECPHRTCMRRV